MHALRPLGPALPRQLYSHLWFKGEFTASIGPARFRMHHPGSVLENEVFWRNTFETERGTMQVFADCLRDADGFIDVGANSGVFTLLAKALKPDLKTLAVEPSPANAKLLRRNVALNGLDVAVVEAAATAAEGMATLHDFPGLSYSASLESSWRAGRVTRAVPAVTLDGLVERHRFAGALVVKIDVEGHEPAVIQGGRRTAREATLLVEIIRDRVARGVAELLEPGRHLYQLIDERTGALIDATDAFAAGAQVPFGNYLVRPAPGSEAGRWASRCAQKKEAAA